MRIEDLDSISYAEGGNLFSSRKWLDLLRAEYGFAFKAVMDESSHPLMLFCEIGDLLGNRIISLPFCDYVEPMVQDNDTMLSVLELLKNAYNDSSITLRLHGQVEDVESLGYQGFKTAICHRVPLEGGSDAIWKNTDYAFKKGVNRARADGLRVEAVNSTEGIEVFYRMLYKLRKNKFQILPQARSFYMKMYESFVMAGDGNIWVTFHGDTPIAAAFVLHSGKAMFDKMGVSDEDYLKLRPNNILLYEIMKYGSARGLDYLDMGLSNADYAGLIRFKDSMGGIRTPINFYRYTPGSYDAGRERQARELLSKMTAIFVENEMTDAAIQQASGLLYRYFC